MYRISNKFMWCKVASSLLLYLGYRVALLVKCLTCYLSVVSSVTIEAPVVSLSKKLTIIIAY